MAKEEGNAKAIFEKLLCLHRTCFSGITYVYEGTNQNEQRKKACMTYDLGWEEIFIPDSFFYGILVF
jgi:hypothetical protein